MSAPIRSAAIDQLLAYDRSTIADQVPTQLKIEELLREILLPRNDPLVKCRKQFFYSLQREKAQMAVDLLQEILAKCPNLSQGVRDTTRRLLIKTAGKSKRVPSQLKMDPSSIKSRDSNADSWFPMTYIFSFFSSSTEAPKLPGPISGGAYGDVFKGDHEHHGPVCLKKFRIHVAEDREYAQEFFYREVLTALHVSHPNLLKVLGMIGSDCMVTSWVEPGNLLDYFHCRDGAWQPVDRLQVLHQVACGLAYLHGHGLVHGDLKGRNILVDFEGHVLIADYGLTRFTDATRGPPTTICGTMAWMAPELLERFGCPSDTTPYTRQSDVYSFGMLCLESYTLKPPFEAKMTLSLINQIVKGYKRPDPPQNAESNERIICDELWQLMKRCWSASVDDRPVANELETDILTILKA